MKSGIGSATVWLEGKHAGVGVAALAAVNAFGDIRDPETGKLLAGARRSPDSLELAGTALQMKRGIRGGFRRENTTLVVVATNARLSKVEATKLAQLASIGMARTITPVWTMFDGDLVIALSVGNKPSDIIALGVAAGEAVADAVIRAIRHAPSLGGLPGFR